LGNKQSELKWSEVGGR